MCLMVASRDRSWQKLVTRAIGWNALETDFVQDFGKGLRLAIQSGMANWVRTRRYYTRWP